MERKSNTSTEVVETEAVKTRLSRSVRTLVPEEERTLRMRHGAKVTDLQAPLARAAPEGSELADELGLIEMQLMKAMRARGLPTRPSAAAKAATPKTPVSAGSPTKNKIVRALRKKK